MTNYLELSISIHCADMSRGPRKKEVERTWNVFYHSMPSDSEETDDEDSVMFDSDDDMDASFGPERFNGFMKNAPIGGLWVMQSVPPNGENGASNEGKKARFLDSTDAQESFVQTVEPKLPECVRFCDNPRVHLYEQLNEYESDVFDFRLCQFDKMRRQQRRLNGESCWDSDTEEEEEDETIEFLPRDEAAKKKIDPMANPIRPVDAVCVVQYFVETVEVLKTCLKNKIVDPSCVLKKTHAEGQSNDTNCAKDSSVTTVIHIEDPRMTDVQSEGPCVINMNHAEDPYETNMNHVENIYMTNGDPPLTNVHTEELCEMNVNNSDDSFEINMNHREDPNESNRDFITDPRAANIKSSSVCAKCGTEQPLGTTLVKASGPSCRCSSLESEVWSRSGCLAKLMCICGPNSKTKKKLETHPALCEQRVCS